MDENSAASDVTAVSPSENSTTAGLVHVPVRQPRKRRRPALSCNECRRRKVKCDQKIPCTQCTKSKVVLCKYDPDATPHRRETRPASNTTSLETTSSEMPPKDKVSYLIPRRNNVSVAKPLLSNTLTSKTGFQDVNVTQQPLDPSEVSQKGKSVEELNDRIQQLETMVTSLINPEQGQTTTENEFECPIENLARLKGSIHKSRFFTISHWMNNKKEFDQILALKKTKKLEESTELNEALRKCKNLARAIKAQRPNSSYILPDFRSEMPLRATSDLLVQLYFRSFESTHRILHRQSFFRDYEAYWSNPPAAHDTFIIKLLLVMSIGTIFTDEENMAMRSLGLQWITSAQIWLNTPLDKSRLNIASIEVHCLLILARQTHSVGGDSLWISVGSLIRTGMSIGLHRDPLNFPNLPAFQAEIRRRLWTTIIELAIQTSLDCGMPPMISFDEFDCEPPSNYDDADMTEVTKTYPPEKPESVFTDSSIQRTLLKSLHTRFKIFKTINEFHAPPPYEKVLALGTELNTHLAAHSKLYHSSSSSSSSSTATTKSTFTNTHKSLLDLLVRRFLLALHLPFSIRARKDPRFYFSRKIALDTSLIIFSYPSSSSPSSSSDADADPDDFERMKLISGGPFREAFSRASSSISLELIAQISEDTSSFPSTSYPSSTSPISPRKQLHDALNAIVALSRRRIERGETNVKGFLFWMMVRAQTKAMESGEDVSGAIARGARGAAEEACGILRRQVVDTPPGETEGGGSGSGSLFESPGDLNVDWDVLMQDTGMDFNMANTWLLDSWENI